MRDEIQTFDSGQKSLRLPTNDLKVFNLLQQWLYQESVDPLPTSPHAASWEWVGADRGWDMKEYWRASARDPFHAPLDPWRHIRFYALAEALDIPAAREVTLKRLEEAVEDALPSFNEEQVDWIYAHTTQASPLRKFVIEKIIFGATGGQWFRHNLCYSRLPHLRGRDLSFRIDLFVKSCHLVRADPTINYPHSHRYCHLDINYGHRCNIVDCLICGPTDDEYIEFKRKRYRREVFDLLPYHFTLTGDTTEIPIGQRETSHALPWEFEEVLRGTRNEEEFLKELVG